VELGALVTLGFPHGALCLSGAELAEVLGGFGDDIFEELEGDAAEGFTCTMPCGMSDGSS
jgi:hypothetical protein